MKIKKCLVLVICLVGLILSLLPVSFAYNQSVGSVNSPLTEPQPSFSSSSDFTFYMVGYFTDGRGYELGEFHITGLSASDKFCVKNGFIRSSVNCSIVINVYDISTGTLLNELSSVFMTELSSPVDTYYYWSYGSIFAQINGNTGGLYYILPDSTFINVLGSNYSPAFVTWSEQPLQHNIYHSELSEPVADEYNSYFICNDKLYWLSYRANGLYSYTQNVEFSSLVSSESASFGSSGSGSYSGQSGGQTETVTAPYVIVSGSVSNGEVFNGSASSPNFGQIDYVGSSQGNLSFSQNGIITYNSVDVYPVSISNQLLNRLFDVVIYLTDSSGFKVWLVPRSDLGQSLILDASLYCSAFNLSNGDYLSSSFSSYTGSYQYAGFDYRVSDSISDVRCYGCAFYNLNNIPVNLSDVLWQYDLSFVLWREDVLQKLNDIYNVLSEAESITSYQAPDLASKMDDENIINDLSYNSGDVQQDLNDNIDRGIQALGSDGGVLQSLSSQIIGLGNGKIFSLLIISLSLGILILILGKNKND